MHSCRGRLKGCAVGRIGAGWFAGVAVGRGGLLQDACYARDAAIEDVSLRRLCWILMHPSRIDSMGAGREAGPLRAQADVLSLRVTRPGVPLELCGSFRPCDSGDCPLALVQIDRLSKSSLGRTATAERAQHVREPEAGIGLQCQ